MFRAVCFMLTLFALSPLSSFEFKDHKQVLLVVSESFDCFKAKMSLFEKTDAGWSTYEQSLPVVLGARGLAWGPGLQGEKLYPGPQKKEKDFKSPAGIFEISTLFGLQPQEQAPCFQMPYIHFKAHLEAIDDPLSKYYNQIVHTDETLQDWSSSEKLAQIPLYQWGAIVNYNTKPIRPHLGSAIYLHLWKSSDQGTCGCTAMSEEHLLKTLLWLDAKKKPILIQLTRSDYLRFKETWMLPLIE